MGYHSLRSGLGLHRHHSVPFRTPGRRVRWFKPQAFQLEIDRGIQVSIQDHTALRTIIDTLVKSDLLVVPTAGAALRRRKGRPDFLRSAASFAENPQKCSEGQIRHLLAVDALPGA
jgi:hypothetical protein